MSSAPPPPDPAGTVALVTGGAQGIGAGVARRLAGRGMQVVIADIEPAGQEVAREIGGRFVRTDVRDLEQLRAAVAEAQHSFGGLDVVHLNAGVSTGCGLAEDFDLERYRRAMAVNLDGVVFGVVAALPALRARGGGDIIATASMAGLTSVPFDPVYGANKHAVVGLVRALGPAHSADNVRINALCPSFADTAILDDLRPLLEQSATPVLAVADVVDAFVAILEAGRTGECWYVQAGRPSEPFRFRNLPGPRSDLS